MGVMQCGRACDDGIGGLRIGLPFEPWRRQWHWGRGRPAREFKPGACDRGRDARAPRPGGIQPRGGNKALSDAEVKAAVDYLLERALQ
ncbi:MAG: hypothetical protein KF778_22090 [Rhodocyclaceae bacterium]|nr:hypothetical protein [Rhodocyclaceae bacterium]